MDVFALIGDPVEHSLSPPMHEAAYEELGMDARYVTFEPESAPAAIEAAQALGLSGLNVTIPFKRSVLDAVEPAPLAARIGAVNTVVFEQGRAVGHNTDAAGAVRALEQHDVALSGQAVVVGAGGAGRAVAFGLADAGMDVAVANRTTSKAEELAAAIRGEETQSDGSTSGGSTNDESTSGGGSVNDDGCPSAAAHGLDALPDLLADASVLVNCTSVGMEEDRSPVPADALHADLAVLDAVYTPIETRLLRDAAAAGATTVDGAWMLLHQGAAAFEHWTGRDAPVEAMNDALRAHL